MGQPITFDPEFLREDLRLGISYAARAGLLKDDAALQVGGRLADGSNDPAPAGGFSIIRALNEISQLIAPVTIADLRFGRDPFDQRNQRRSKRIQMVLTLAALLFLLLIGHFMHALRQEQEAVAALGSLQELKPVEKLTALRKLAQYETPFSSPATLYDEYHQKVLEIGSIRQKVLNSYQLALDAEAIPFFPLEQYVSGLIRFAATRGTAAAAPSAAEPAATSSADAVAVASKGSVLDGAATTPDAERCVVDPSGEIQLPRESLKYPLWMQKVMADATSDFCFQQKVISGDGQSAMVDASFTAFAAPYVTLLKGKASLRADWFLPFFYGLLGATVCMMRTVASVRTPAAEALPIVMRVALGGVAGIVIGWFSAVPVGVSAAINTFSLPFFLAFLAGYGIDAVFSTFDKASRAIGQAASPSA